MSEKANNNKHVAKRRKSRCQSTELKTITDATKTVCGDSMPSMDKHGVFFSPKPCYDFPAASDAASDDKRTICHRSISLHSISNCACRCHRICFCHCHQVCCCHNRYCCKRLNNSSEISISNNRRQQRVPSARAEESSHDQIPPDVFKVSQFASPSTDVSINEKCEKAGKRDMEFASIAVNDAKHIFETAVQESAEFRKSTDSSTDDRRRNFRVSSDARESTVVINNSTDDFKKSLRQDRRWTLDLKNDDPGGDEKSRPHRKPSY